jgi:Ca2+-transporting ATPase
MESAPILGLTQTEAARRLREEGYNELPVERGQNLWSTVVDVLRQPMFLLLVGCGTIYLIIGSVREALMLLGFVFVVMGITIYQQRKTERALDALRDLSSPRALVIREGEQARIPGREVVRGDLLIVSEGDRVPADAVLKTASNLHVDESLLTGESVPVRKRPGQGMGEMVPPGGEGTPCVYSGTLIVAGQGLAETRATGSRTEIGKIGKALASVSTGETPLQQETSRLVRMLALVGLGLCLFVAIIYGFTRGDWLHGMLAGLTLAMALLPEELPVVLTVFLALGAWRISQQRVLTRHLPAIETLGSCTVLCVDKTGTLTLNRMSVRKLCLGLNNGADECYEIHRAEDEVPSRYREMVLFGLLASKRNSIDPMEKALQQLASTVPPIAEKQKAFTLTREYPFTHELLAMSQVYQSSADDYCVVATKGAPEAIADLCRLNSIERKELERQLGKMAEEGLRVLAVAKAMRSSVALPVDQRGFDFEFLGLVGLADPVRPAVRSALQECYTAGMRVVMITGDYPLTALSIARQIGLQSHGECVTGPQLDAMDDAELQRRIRTVNVFARVVPQQKLRLVSAFKANGEVVAMTGDGVNDAPALKAAHIGIAMGGRGTDVAREASTLVLLDDDFSSIVQAVKIGRRIFDNIQKALAYTFAVHVPIAGMSLIPVLFTWPLLLFPIHIVFLELIIDPACSIVFEGEPEERGIMRRPPRRPKDPLVPRRLLRLSLLQGVSVLLIVLAVYAVALQRGQGELVARALAFTTLIISNLGLILTNRSWSRTIWETLRSPNVALWWVIGGAMLFLLIALYTPFSRELFGFALLRPVDLVLCTVAGALSVVWFEILKIISRRQGWSQRGLAGT